MHYFQDLILANEEFASEVDKLYKAEDQQLREKEELSRELKEVEDKLETRIEFLQSNLVQEKELREDGEMQIATLSQELGKAERELKGLQNLFKDNQNAIEEKNKEKNIVLKEQNENLTAENFEYAIENVSYIEDDRSAEFI